MSKRKVLFVFGTRPEAIKMAPLIKQFQTHTEQFDTFICVTGQHREMLDQVLEFFEIKPDHDLNLMRAGQNLFQITADVILGIKPILEEIKPGYVFIHGDTTTSTATALAAFYASAKICHVEAGLRTYNKYSPFPEEMNRQITGRLTDIHFAPTTRSKENLLKENIPEENIVVTSNTVIDALIWANNKLISYVNSEIDFLESIIDKTKKLILVTGHRRENFGDGFLNICRALNKLSTREDVQIIYPVHLNPNVQKPVYELLQDVDNIRLISPLGYPAFVWLMSKSYIILTDSGGVQEEAPSLGKPVLVMRDNTERPEAIEAGTVILVGTSYDNIVTKATLLLDDAAEYSKMSLKHNPYGDGNASLRIINHILNE
ncbi:MAG: UDP-N-acetylglucosamine 2-epimerase (non-hydrolyzing) [Bacteroidota bacterium]